MASSASRQLRSESERVSDIWKDPEESEGCSCGIALDGRLGQAYNEEAFHYFLEIERRRARLSSRPLFLLVIDLKSLPGMSVHIESPIAERLFVDLATCLRETDFVGWYRVERAIGAVLTQRADGEAPRTEIAPRLRARIAGAIGKGISREAEIGFRCVSINFHNFPEEAFVREAEPVVALETASSSFRGLDRISRDRGSFAPTASQHRPASNRRQTEGTESLVRAAGPALHVINEKLFRGALIRERKTADRCNQPFGLLLVGYDVNPRAVTSSTWAAAIEALAAVKRDTDVLGWFEEQATLDVILPEDWPVGYCHCA